MYYDVTIFDGINGLANHSVVADAIGIFIADYVPYLLGIWLLLFFFRPKPDLKKNRAMVFLALTSGFIARFIVKTIIVIFYQRPRPYVSLSPLHKIVPMSPFYNFESFPSGHALFFFAVSAIVYCFNKKLGIIFFICSLCIGLARIFVGVHWPSDILGGAVLGTGIGYFTYWFYKKFYAKPG